jgi:anti-anti-sigma regulatory factor
MSLAYQQAPSNARTRRMLTFVVTLAVLNIPLLIIGLLDASKSLLTLILVLVAYGYYALYYTLVRAGYGVLATYGCVLLLVLLIGVGVHNGGGYLLATGSLYVLLLVAVGLVLDEPRALDLTLVVCLLGYGGLAYYEHVVAPPLVFAELYQTQNRLAVGSVITALLLSMVGVWRLMRTSLVSLRRSTAAIERARYDAEQSARENAELVAQAHERNLALSATEARLRDTVDALALPLIPLAAGVALLPLVGFVDDRRAEQLLDGLLRGVHEQRIRAVVIDITGLRDIDERVARALLQAADAARLLGAEVVISGIGAEAAQAIVSLGIDLRALRTAGSLGAALQLLGTGRPSASGSAS